MVLTQLHSLLELSDPLEDDDDDDNDDDDDEEPGELRYWRRWLEPREQQTPPPFELPTTN